MIGLVCTCYIVYRCDSTIFPHFIYYCYYYHYCYYFYIIVISISVNIIAFDILLLLFLFYYYINYHYYSCYHYCYSYHFYFCYIYIYAHHPESQFRVFSDGGSPSYGWFRMENPTKMDDDWGYPYDLSETTRPGLVNFGSPISPCPWCVVSVPLSMTFTSNFSSMKQHSPTFLNQHT